MANRTKICICYVISAILIIILIYSVLFMYVSSIAKLKRLEYDVEEITKLLLRRNLDDELLSKIGSCVKERTQGFWNELVDIKRKLEIIDGRSSVDDGSEERECKICKAIAKDLSDTVQDEPDYSMDSLGASVVDVDDIPLYPTNFLLRFFGVKYSSNYPGRILEPSMQLGHCYAFRGNKSSFVLKLSHKVIIKSITVEHIPAHASLTGDISNAPKEFYAYGVEYLGATNDTFLGTFQYNNLLKKRAQRFQLSNEKPYLYCKIKVSSNHGNKHHTCIYR